VFVIGNRQHALGILGHDGGHYLVSSNKKWNDILTCVFAFWPLIIDMKDYREFHFLHHRVVGSKEDPEWDFNKYFTLPATKAKIWMTFLLDLTGIHLMDSIKIGRIVGPKNVKQAVIPVLYVTAIMGLLLYFGFYQAVLMWFAALGTSFVAVFKMRIWSEHIGADHTHRLRLNRWQSLLFAPHNTWYHWEHHEYPSVPCHQLPQISVLDLSRPAISFGSLLEFFENIPKTSK
jgi:fatty acid desaturase